METLKDMIRALGYDPEKILMKEAFVEPHRTVISNSEDRETTQIEFLTKTLRELFHSEKNR